MTEEIIIHNSNTIPNGVKDAEVNHHNIAVLNQDNGNKSSSSLYHGDCIVCGDISSGYHYGVLSCEGCKGFFKRTIQTNRQYHCKKNDACPISKETRNSCQACRLKLCFDKGMHAELVRQDRTPGNRRKRPLNDKEIASLNYSVVMDLNSKPLPERVITKESPNPNHLKPNTLTNGGQQADSTYYLSKGTVPNRNNSGFSSSGIDSVLDSPDWFNSINQSRVGNESSPNIPYSDALTINHHSSNSYTGETYSSTDSGLSMSRFDSNRSNSCLTNSRSSVPDDSPPSAPVSNEEDEEDSHSGEDEHFFHSTATEPIRVIKPEEYNYAASSSTGSAASVPSTLSNPDSTSSPSYSTGPPPTKALRICYENCSPMAKPDAINQLDARVRQFIDVIMKTAPNAVPELNPDAELTAQLFMDIAFVEVEMIIRFSKKVPGFFDLPMNDKKHLMRTAFLSIQVIRLAFRSLDLQMGMFRFSTSVVLDKAGIQDISHYPEGPIVLTHELMEWFRAIRIDEVECALLQVLVLMSDEISELTEKARVREIQNFTLRALREYNVARFPNHPERLGVLLLRLPLVRKLSMVCAENFLLMVDCGFFDMSPLTRDLMASLPDPSAQNGIPPGMMPPGMAGPPSGMMPPGMAGPPSGMMPPGMAGPPSGMMPPGMALPGMPGSPFSAPPGSMFDPPFDISQFELLQRPTNSNSTAPTTNIFTAAAAANPNDGNAFNYMFGAEQRDGCVEEQ